MKALMGAPFNKIRNDPLGRQQLVEFLREQPVEKLITLSTGERYWMSGSKKHRPKYQMDEPKTFKGIVSCLIKLVR